jgi:hypothetical protein
MAGMAERFVIPDDLARAGAREGRDDWLAALPALVARIAADWVFLEGADVEALASRMARLLDLDLSRILRWLFARAVEASPYWAGMADLARTLNSLLA